MRPQNQLMILLIGVSLLSLVSTKTKTINADFVWGTSSAAYQIEGAWNIDGKAPSIWDDYTSHPGHIYANQTGQVADDFYHRYQEDIDNMKKLGIKNFRLSISWPRVLPKGTVDSVNQKGVDFYNKVFKALDLAGIEPWVTLYHWDLPSALNDKTSTGGWLNPDIVNKFNHYADFCFKTFGDRVKNWITVNEIQEFAWAGYGWGGHAPGRCSPEVQASCASVGGGGNTATEPYIVAHHALLAHATAVKTYRTKYQDIQGGQIGMSIDTNWAEPFDPNNPADVKAVETYLAFKYAWLADPIVFGKYPDIMVEYVGNRLPKFTDAEVRLLKGSYDFLGLNHYSTRYIVHTGVVGTDYYTDPRCKESITDVNGNQIGPLGGNAWLYVYPQGIRRITKWVAKRYDNVPQYIFENGAVCPDENTMPREQAIKDTFRIGYIRDYVANVVQAKLSDNINIKGYFLWSLLDNFEWSDGYSVRFGITYVDYADQKRYLKNSAYFYATLIHATHNQDTEDENSLAHLLGLTQEFYEI